MDPKELDDMLARTLQDGKISRSERQVLGRIFEEAGHDARQRAFVRNRAFEAARAAVDSPRMREVLAWLQDVVSVATESEESTAARTAEAFFSPGEECVNRIRGLISGARRSVDICVFTITDDRISRAIQDAMRRGTRVRIVTDNEKAYDLGSDIEQLARAGVPVAVDTSPYHMHHKFAIFDERLLLTGSYNWTRGAAEQNEENFVVTDEPKLVAAFGEQFEQLWQRFRPGAAA